MNMRDRKDTVNYTHSEIMLEINEVRAILENHGYSTKGRYFNVSTRMWANNIWGKCRVQGNNVTIFINPYVIKYGSPEHVHQLIAHEVCHAVIGAKGHGLVWKNAAKVLSSYGYKDIYRCESMPEVTENHPKDYKWQVICNGCGNTWKYQRNSKIVQIANGTRKGWLTCTKCNCKKFSVKYIG